MLLLLDRYSRKLYGRALPNRSAGVTVPAVLDMLQQAREDDAKPDPEVDVLFNMDKAGEFVSAEFTAALEAAGVRTRFKKDPQRVQVVPPAIGRGGGK